MGLFATAILYRFALMPQTDQDCLNASGSRWNFAYWI